jgi:two-component system OmpR family response regulator
VVSYGCDVRVLVVEDDVALGDAVSRGLRAGGFAVDTVRDWPDADVALSVNSYACLVLDRMLPAGDSLEELRALRDAGCVVPALFLTARDVVADRVAGFAAGGDDYLIKPFAMEELVARVRVLARRAAATLPPVLRCADVTMDPARREVRRGGVLLPMRPKELSVLEVLLSHADIVVSRSELIERCWDEMAEPMSNVVDVVVATVRRKLGEPPLIHTVRGFGYLFGIEARR